MVETRISLSEQIACVRREVRLRERVYPRRIAEGRMRQAEADRELVRMRAVLQTLEEAERGQRLF